MRHILDIPDLSAAEIERIFEIAADLKQKHAGGVRPPLLAGRCMALLFEKPSLRTRVSFQAGMAQLGGSSMFLGEDVGWGSRESNADFAGALTEYVDVVVCRAKSHAKVEELAAHSKCPVVNGLTDLAHPCQALADLVTLREVCKSLAGRKVAASIPTSGRAWARKPNARSAPAPSATTR
jgi:ornithine carbamoyltransferase